MKCTTTQTGVMSEVVTVEQDRRIHGKRQSHVRYQVPGSALSFRITDPCWLEVYKRHKKGGMKCIKATRIDVCKNGRIFGKTCVTWKAVYFTSLEGYPFGK